MTQANDLVEQAVGYCRHQAAKGIDSLAALMDRTAADWGRCLEGMNDQQAEFSAGDEWSARQVVNHFLDVTAGVNGQIARVIAGGDLGSTDEADLATAGEFPEAQSPDDMREGVARLFAEMLDLTRSLEGNPNLEKTFPHPMFGQLNILEWVAFQRIHSMDHIGQIEKNKAEAAYPGA
jgi:hypothetical protein